MDWLGTRDGGEGWRRQMLKGNVPAANMDTSGFEIPMAGLSCVRAPVLL